MSEMMQHTGPQSARLDRGGHERSITISTRRIRLGAVACLLLLAAAVEAPQLRAMQMDGAGRTGGSAEAKQTQTPVMLADSLGGIIHEATIRGNVEILRDARTLAERALTVYPEQPLLTYWYAQTYFREAGRVYESEPDRAESLLDRAEAILERAAADEAMIPESYALLGSVLGMQISNPIDGMTIGPEADAAIDRALELDPDNPRIWLAKGIGTLHKPGFIGGGAEAALEQFERAAALFENDDPGPGYPAWGAAELRAWMGIAYVDQERPKLARRAFQAALRIEPEYGWVRYVLLPQLDN